MSIVVLLIVDKVWVTVDVSESCKNNNKKNISNSDINELSKNYSWHDDKWLSDYSQWLILARNHKKFFRKIKLFLEDFSANFVIWACLIFHALIGFTAWSVSIMRCSCVCVIVFIKKLLLFGPLMLTHSF
jgi:hypothetical protein